jgi:V/A-type H+-transporting ATPase subunit F
MKLVVLGDKQTSLLFGLVGVECRIVEDQNTALDEIKKIRKTKNFGLIVVTERVAEWARDLINQMRFSKELPLIIDIPDHKGHIEGMKNLAEYIREAVGIRI